MKTPDNPDKVHYHRNPETGENRFPCNNERPTSPRQVTNVLDFITCPACNIALPHQAATFLKVIAG